MPIVLCTLHIFSCMMMYAERVKGVSARSKTAEASIFKVSMFPAFCRRSSTTQCATTLAVTALLDIKVHAGFYPVHQRRPRKRLNRETVKKDLHFSCNIWWLQHRQGYSVETMATIWTDCTYSINLIQSLSVAPEEKKVNFLNIFLRKEKGLSCLHSLMDWNSQQRTSCVTVISWICLMITF